MEKITNAEKKKIDFHEGSKEKILQDNIINAIEEGNSRIIGVMEQILNAINNLKSSTTNSVKDKNENPNLTHSLGKSLTESSKKNSNSNKTANSHPNYIKKEVNSNETFPRKSNIFKNKQFKKMKMLTKGKEKKGSQFKTFQSLLPPKKRNTKNVFASFAPKADRINKKNEKKIDSSAKHNYLRNAELFAVKGR